MIADWLMRNVEGVLLALIILMVVLLGALGAAQDSVRNRFMTGCLLDRKEYECIAIWKNGWPLSGPASEPASQP